MTINSEQLFFILDNTPSDQNIMLVGKHGIGKSRILEEYFSKKGQKVVTLFLGQMSDPGDLLGLPEKNLETGKTDFMLPYWFPTDGKPIVLFMDELNRSRQELLQTVMDLTLNRKLAGKSLPEGSRIISAVNNGNEYQLTDLDPALVSRFNIYDFSPTVEDWIRWAKSENLDSRIINFISENPEYLDGSEVQQENDGLERSPDRRSWERTSQIIKNFSELNESVQALVSGIIGNKATVDFFRWAKENKIPGAKKILTENFSLTQNELKNILPLEWTQINENIFRFIQAEAYTEEDKNLISKNLILYFDFLEQNNLTEIQAQFISLCSAEKFPKVLNFITENAPDFYKKIMDFVSTL